MNEKTMEEILKEHEKRDLEAHKLILESAARKGLNGYKRQFMWALGILISLILSLSALAYNQAISASVDRDNALDARISKLESISANIQAMQVDLQWIKQNLNK